MSGGRDGGVGTGLGVGTGMTAIASRGWAPSLGNLSNWELCFVISFNRHSRSIWGSKVLAPSQRWWGEGRVQNISQVGDSPQWG